MIRPSSGAPGAASEPRGGGPSRSARHRAQCAEKFIALRVRTHRDPQELIDARLREVSNEDAPRAEIGRQRCGVTLCMPREEEIGCGRQNLEAELGKARAEPLSACHHFAARL